MAVWSQSRGGVRLRVRVQPRSSRNQVVGVHDDAVKIRVTASPVEGAANRAVVEVLAGWLAVPRRAVTVVQGRAARDKVVEIAGEAPERLAARLREALAAFIDKAQERG